MTKFEFSRKDDDARYAVAGRALPFPFVAQGVRDALRNAYAGPIDIPAEFNALLERLN